MSDTPHGFSPTSGFQAGALAIPFLLSLIAQFAGPSPAPMAAPPARPALAFHWYLVDKGPVAPSEEVSVPFHFTNRGHGDVNITELVPSCGCLNPELKQRHYVPGETGGFKLRVQTANQLPGQKEYQVTVKYSDPEPREASVVFRVVLPENQVLIRPPALLFSLPEGSPPTEQEIHVVDLRDRHLKVTRVDCHRKIAAVEQLDDEVDDLGRWRGNFKVVVPGDLPARRYDELVRIFTDDPDYPMLRVPLVIDVRSPRTITDPHVRAASGTR